MNTRLKKRICLGLIAGLSSFIIISSPTPAHAMHIMEGFLPVKWAFFWWLVTIPFLVIGFKSLVRITQENPELKLLLALSGAFGFVLSALKIPSVTGSSSHPTGTGLGAILFGPPVMAVLGSLILLFQAVLLAHGGLTTLGANIFSMAIVGSWVAFVVYKFCVKIGRQKLGIFLGASLGNLSTYVITSIQLAVVFPAVDGGILTSFLKFAGIFAITQIPLAISEGFLTVLVWNWLQSYAVNELEMLKLLKSQEG